MSALHSLLFFLLALGLLITIHEFGHFWVARRSGVKILRFSVGFGRPLYKRLFGPDRTEFVIAALPLGGYVKMLDEREGPVPEAELGRAFNRQPVLVRIAVVLAGPLANLLFAVVAYWLMFVIGVAGLKPVVGEVTPGSPAAVAGLEPGVEIIEVEGRRTPTWEAVVDACLDAVLDGGSVELAYRRGEGVEKETLLDLSGLDLDSLNRGRFFEVLGFDRYRPKYPPVIGEVVPGGVAEESGLRPGDRVVSVDGEPVDDWSQLVGIIRSSPGKALQVEVERGGELLSLILTPRPVESGDGKMIGRIGAIAAPDEEAEEEAKRLFVTERYGPLEAVPRAFGKSWKMTRLTLQVLGRMVIGEASLENLSGPISIARYAGQSASFGLVPFLSFLAIVSLSLGVLNLLPIPVLDGGHLLYYLIELVAGRPLPESAQEFGQQIGLLILLLLMGIALYNDILRLAG